MHSLLFSGGGAVSRLFHWKGAVGKILSLILALSLTITGIYDFAVILKDNDSGHRVSVNLNSGLTSWLAENLKKRRSDFDTGIQYK